MAPRLCETRHEGGQASRTDREGETKDDTCRRGSTRRGGVAAGDPARHAVRRDVRVEKGRSKSAFGRHGRARTDEPGDRFQTNVFNTACGRFVSSEIVCVSFTIAVEDVGFVRVLFVALVPDPLRHPFRFPSAWFVSHRTLHSSFLFPSTSLSWFGSTGVRPIHPHRSSDGSLFIFRPWDAPGCPLSLSPPLDPRTKRTHLGHAPFQIRVEPGTASGSMGQA